MQIVMYFKAISWTQEGNTALKLADGVTKQEIERKVVIRLN